MEQEDIWTGSYFDLSIELPLTTDSRKIKEALSSIKQLDKFSFTIFDDPLQVGDVLYLQGTVGDYPCMLSVMVVENEATWLDFSLPVNLLETKFNVVYPLTVDNNTWISSIHKLYTDLATSIFKRLPFHMAIIGEEVAGMTTSTELDVATLQTMSAILPLELQKKLDLESDGELLSHQLRFYPR
ncbi:hypothetical protein [Bacillus sp. FJAT-45066]|uniref:hypothetical protein n=1 Tax=Bacillus sp. FJAT-45066 TaxID=2011010 RepID=UPI000BB950C3|nr:hypothetical protein [Bacillus sp. FJAT-45066]